MVEILLYIQIGLCLLPLYRIIRGPTIGDRIVGINMIGILVTGICIILIFFTDQPFLMDVVIGWIIFNFISTLTIAKYFENKKFNE